jgi:DNA-directed RNA polymerase specialized sigma24 family protein
MSACAKDRQDFSLWSEFLRRVTPKIKCFIRGSLRPFQSGSMTASHGSAIRGGGLENDLLQNTLLRLVGNDCAAMKRFAGRTENEVFAYLAVITRSVVRDCLRMESAQRRPPGRSAVEFSAITINGPNAETRAVQHPAAEREILLHEVKELSQQALRCTAKKFAARDSLIFQLCFHDGLSPNQIAQCEGVRLTKTGVEKVLGRLTQHLRRAASVGISGGVAR